MACAIGLSRILREDRATKDGKYGDPCPVCGGFHLAATGGTEMRVIDFVPED